MRALLVAASIAAACGQPYVHDPRWDQRPPVATHGSPTLKRGLVLYETMKFEESLSAFEEVERGGTNDDERDRGRALFFIGKCEFNLKRYPEAAAAFGRIIDAGPTHDYYRKSIIWIAALSRFARDPEPFPVLVHLAKLDDDLLADPGTFKDATDPQLIRDEMCFRVGAWCLAHEQVERGRKLLAIVDPKSMFYKRAQALLRR